MPPAAPGLHWPPLARRPGGRKRMSGIRIVMTLLVRNEEDVLEDHLAYHFRRGVDFVIAMDNASSDRTPEILEEYARRGLAHVIREPSDVYRQSEWVTRMARLAATDF